MANRSMPSPACTDAGIVTRCVATVSAEDADARKVTVSTAAEAGSATSPANATAATTAETRDRTATLTPRPRCLMDAIARCRPRC